MLVPVSQLESGDGYEYFHDQHCRAEVTVSDTMLVFFLSFFNCIYEEKNVLGI